MSEPVFGTGVVVEIGDPLKIVLCATDCVFTRTPELILTTNPESGLFNDYMVRRDDWDVTVTGLTKIENDTSATFFYLLQTSVRRIKQPIRITFTDPDGDNKQISGQVLIGQQSISGPATDFASCSIEFKGCGAFAIEEVTPPDPIIYDILSDFWIIPAGLSYADLAASSEVNGYNISAGDLLLEVNVEGTGYEIVLTPPGNRECLLNNSFVLNLNTDDNMPVDRRVFVMFKRPV